MKTQISNLRTGKKDFFKNSLVDYSTLKRASSHVGTAGSNSNECKVIYDAILNENKELLTIELFSKIINIIPRHSVSGKSTYLTSDISIELLNKFGIVESKTKTPYISIHDANSIVVHNGKNSYKYICPSLITIL